MNKKFLPLFLSGLFFYNLQLNAGFFESREKEVPNAPQFTKKEKL